MSESDISEWTAELIKNYEDIFEAPTSLPPFRKRDHFIYTFPDSKPVSVRPCTVTHNSEGRNGKSSKGNALARYCET